MTSFIKFFVLLQVANAFSSNKVIFRHVINSNQQLFASDGPPTSDKESASSLFTEPARKLEEGLNSSKEDTFDKLVTENEPNAETSKTSSESEVAAVSTEVPVVAVSTEVPVVAVSTEVPAAVSTEVPVVPVDIPIRSMPIVDEALATEDKKIEIMKAQQGVTTDFFQNPTEEVAPAVAQKKVVEVKKPPTKSGGFFSFLQSDSQVQNIAQQSKPKSQSSSNIAKAFQTPAVVEVKVQKVEKLEDMFKKTPEEMEAKKKMMAENRPSLAQMKAEALKAEAPEAIKAGASRVPSPAPVKAVVTPDVLPIVIPDVVSVFIPDVIVPAAAQKKAVEVKPPAKVGGFFSFLQSDSAVQNIANKNKPTEPPAQVKAFQTPAPVEVKKVKEVKKTKEGLNMVMYQQTPEEISEVKRLMVDRPTLASMKAMSQAAEEEDEDEEVVDAPRVPSKAPVKAVKPAEPVGGMFSFMEPKKTDEAKNTVTPSPVVEKETFVPKKAPSFAPQPKKDKGLFGFLTSDATLVPPVQRDFNPSAPPAIARAFMAPSPVDAQKEEKELSLAALQRQLEFEQDVKDEEVKKQMMTGGLSLAEAKAEAGKSLSKAQIREAAARAAGTSTPASKKKEWGVFDLFTQEPDESSGGDQYEPRDPNSLTARESKDYGFDGDLGEGGMAYRAPPSAMPKSVAVAKKAPAPAPIQAPVKAAAPSTPAPSAPTGGFFGFLTPKEETKVVAKKEVVKKEESVIAMVKKATKAPSSAPAPGLFNFLTPTPKVKSMKVSDEAFLKPAPDTTAMAKKVVKAEPSVEKVSTGGLFGFLNPAPAAKAAPTVAKAAPAVAKPAAPIAAKPVKEPSEPAGSFFGFLNQESVPAKSATVVKAPVVVAKKVEKASPSPAPVMKAPAPAAPAGGFFGFLNPSPAVSKKAEPAPAPVVAKKAEPVVSKKSQPAMAVAKKISAEPVVAEKVSTGGFFGFLNPSPAPAKAPKVAPVVLEVVETPVKKAGFTFPSLGSSAPGTRKAKVTLPPVKASPPAKVAVVSAAKAKPVAVGMNAKFLTTISKLLKGDAKKIKSFQIGTDGYRSGDVSADAFLKTLESLFGVEALESVVIPLASELPERDVAAKLKTALEKKGKKTSAPAKAPFSFSFGGGKKVIELPKPVIVEPPVKKQAGFTFPSFGAPKVVEKPIPVPVVAPAKPVPKAGFSFPSFGAPKPSVTPAVSKVIPVFKLPTNVPTAKKAAVEKEVKALLSGASDAKVFYKNIVTVVGKPKAIEVIKDIIKIFPKDVGAKIEAAAKADK